MFTRLILEAENHNADFLRSRNPRHTLGFLPSISTSYAAVFAAVLGRDYLHSF